MSLVASPPLDHQAHPDWVWTGGRLVQGLAVSISPDGRIRSLGPPAPGASVRLAGKALIPGFVSAHSHAFQRALRGVAEGFSAGEGSFFRWREAMYGLVGELTPERCYDLCKQTFLEMLAAGITAVGEFHYVRHLVPIAAGEAPGSTVESIPDSMRYALDASVLAAAKDAGIRMVLLPACYRTGGIGKPLAGGQVRFRTGDAQEYWKRFDALAALLDPTTQSLGACAHSVRAVPIETIRVLHEESVRRGVVFHMHLEEVRQEIVDCVAAYGMHPAELLLTQLALDERSTFVHATHTEPAHLARLAARGATVCLCPLTEGNLGDGICDVAAFLTAGGSLASGSDLNSRLAPTEELRWMEYVQRVRREVRGAVVDGDGDSGAKLLSIGTTGGARSLGLNTGDIAPGRWADFAVVDLEHPTMSGWTPQTFASLLVFGTGTSAVAGVCVGGRWHMRRT